MNILTVTAYDHDMEQIDVTDDNTTSNSNNTASTDEYKNKINMENNNAHDDSDDDNEEWNKHSQHQREHNSPEDRFFESLNFSHAQNKYLIDIDHIGQQKLV